MTTRYVDVTLEEIVNRDSEEFLDLLEILFLAGEEITCPRCGAIIQDPRGYLSGITYRPIDVLADRETLRLEVTADIEKEEDENTVCDDCFDTPPPEEPV